MDSIDHTIGSTYHTDSTTDHAEHIADYIGCTTDPTCAHPCNRLAVGDVGCIRGIRSAHFDGPANVLCSSCCICPFCELVILAIYPARQIELLSDQRRLRVLHTVDM